MNPGPEAPRSKAKLIFFALFLLATAFVTFMKNKDAFDPNSPMARHYAPGMAWLIPHAIFAGLALLMGVFQFSNRLRAKYLALHRKLGWAYVLCVFVGGPLAIPLAVKTGTPVLTAATVMQTLGWMTCTAIALYCVKTGNVREHRRWMIRGYPFAMIFTVARLLIPLPPVQALGIVGVEIVVWTTIALAAFLPSLFLDWGAIVSRRATA
ncbi:MAG TPA: DUF2306 domain-containing protein [Planctomycetota bacterium]